MKRGLFITFEGVDGVGKTTQAGRLADYLFLQNLTVQPTCEPGGTPWGRNTRRLLLYPSAPIGRRAEALLYAADRAQHVAEVVRPALKRGECVISDRYTDSTIAYQVGGRGLDRRDIEWLNEWAAGGLQPDRTYLLDMEPKERRLAGDVDRLEGESVEFQNRVRKAFLDLAEQYPDRILVVDASQRVGDVWMTIKADVDRILAERASCVSE